MDRDLVIQLSSAVEHLRRQIAEDEKGLKAKREQLAATERELDNAIAGAARSRCELIPSDEPRPEEKHSYLLDLLLAYKDVKGLKAAEPTSSFHLGGYFTGHEPDEKVTTLGYLQHTKPSPPSTDDTIAGRIRQLFEGSRFVPLTTSEVLGCLHLADEKEGAVRQALRRLADEGVVVRISRGTYQFNPLFKDGTGSDRYPEG